MKMVLSIILAIVGLAFFPMFLWGLSGILRLNFGLIYMFMLGLAHASKVVSSVLLDP